MPVRLEDDDPASPASLYLMQTGLTGAPDEAAPSHLSTFTATQTTYTLPAGAAELSVPLSWTDGHGLTVTKTFIFKRGLVPDRSRLRCAQRIARRRARCASYAQILRHWEHASRSYFDVETYSFKGPAVFDGTKSHDLKVESEPDSKFCETITNGWLASLQHHFVSAIVPPEGKPYHYRSAGRGPSVPAERDRAVHATRAGSHGDVQRESLHRTEAAVAARGDRPAARTHRRLRHADRHRAALVHGAQLGARRHRQLGLGDHHRHRPDQADLLSLEPGERPLDGEDAQLSRRA